MDRKRLLRNPLIWILAAILVYFTFSVLFDDTRGYTQEPTSVALTQIESGNVTRRADRRQGTAAPADPEPAGRRQHPDHHPVPERLQLADRHGAAAGAEQARRSTPPCARSRSWSRC